MTKRAKFVKATFNTHPLLKTMVKEMILCDSFTNFHFFKINSKIYSISTIFNLSNTPCVEKMSTNLKEVKTKSMKKNRNAISCDKTFSRLGNVFGNFTHLHLGSVGYNKAKSNDFYLQNNAFTYTNLYVYMSFVKES